MSSEEQTRVNRVSSSSVEHVLASDSFNNIEDDFDHFKATTYTYDIGLSMEGNVAY